MAMNIQIMSQTLRHPSFVVLAGWLALACLAACSSSEEAPRGSRVEHPVKPGPKPKPSPVVSPLPTIFVQPSTSAPPMPTPSAHRPTPSEIYEEHTKTALSPIEKAIMDDCPPRAWSKNVPKRACTKDEQCGDGFCDRGQCAAIWTCHTSYGQRCVSDDWCSHYLCLEGRCRSCISTAECKDEPDNQDPQCVLDPWYVPSGRLCHGVAPSKQGDIAPGLPPTK